MEIPVYLFTGLLESGKTTLIQEVVGEEGFLDPGNTVLVQCEEGETGFSEEFLQGNDITLIKVENKDELNENFWRSCKEKYSPAQIMIEYNGMWTMADLFESRFPDECFLGGIYSAVDASTADMYMTNMRKTFMEPLKESNLIIFNRCDDDTDRVKYRRNLKAVNPQVQVAFERKDGTMFADEAEVMPYDYSSETVQIEDMDYGLWYLDAMDNPDRYIDMDITFTARYCASREPGQKHFVPGRHVMTCCEDDIQFLGFICTFDGDMPYQHGEWVKVTAHFDYGYNELYGEEGPVLHLVRIEDGAQPEQELVTFT